jgi:hypothetical protein
VTKSRAQEPREEPEVPQPAPASEPDEGVEDEKEEPETPNEKEVAA